MNPSPAEPTRSPLSAIHGSETGHSNAGQPTRPVIAGGTVSRHEPDGVDQEQPLTPDAAISPSAIAGSTTRARLTEVA
ncbi:hypothetical protein ABZT04_30940 [Streptomyces sp. NPDC005492]|uniref:hypothetical protein n=1 Tax=Streptomyces sp. NPDC005492 TaxID=3156883 RepID=UPI00339F450F